MANTYACSDGTRVDQKTIDYRIKKAKAQKKIEFIDEHGYLFCEDCERNDCKPIDASHEVSVYEAKKTGRTELCWSVENLRYRGRPCHQRYDKLDVQFNPNRV
ncbi:hypothetical protein BD809_10997 [Aquimarina intermedia]|uniref:HNH endonuclease n=1 Tax=Aquimarina intermedia TaxID=350814 RepID=A0A5S5BWF9_9FLAO|nr:hypothetical protein BD809_10997 [Aquimarina intermedia]